MIWYSIEHDEIFLSGYLDAHFFGLLSGIDWSNVEVIDYFGDE